MDELDWSMETINSQRERYYSATQQAFMPYQTPLAFKRGEMQYLFDAEGNKLLDLLGMNLCISVGHCHPKVNAAAITQINELVHSTTMFNHPVPAVYAKELVETFPADEDWVVHFTNSGAEAVDLALYMARTATGNTDVIAMDGSYHGATSGAQSVTGISGFRQAAIQLGGVAFVEGATAYRGGYGDNVDRYLEDLRTAVNRRTTGALAGIIAEPIQGYGGVIPLLDGYLSGAADIVRDHGGLVIIDEVQTGFGRTGESFWAFERENIVPDIVVLAKGISNGFPMGAVVAKRSVADTMANKFSFHTYGANPVSAAAARVVLDVLKRDDYQTNAMKLGALMLDGLRDLQSRYNTIGDVRGRGLMVAIEFVSDRETKEPATEFTAALFEETRRQGLVVSKSGPNRNTLRMVPPLCLTTDDISFAVERMETAIKNTL